MMDKSCHSSGEESSAINPNNNNNNNLDSKDHQYLKQIHKLSHKISKPPIRKPFDFDHHQIQIHHQPSDSNPLDQSQPSILQHNNNQQQQHQPPVYNVSKNDFRNVVQKLTGSPAHENISIPSPVHPVQSTHPVQSSHPVQQPVRPQTSRLHRIRPPPLEHLVNRPPSNPNFRPAGNFFSGLRPLSPLPPLPTVHAAAESPISAYMRCFQTGVSPPENIFPAPESPLAFGCLPAMLSPRYPFSPTNQFGFQQLTPLSPTPPAPSPRWKAV